MLRIRLICEGLVLAGIDRLMLHRIVSGNYAVILNIHRVCDQVNHYAQPLRPHLFEKLLLFLKKRFRLTTIAGIDAVRRPPNGETLEKSNDDKRPQLVLSFDDGCWDFMEIALPLMQKHTVPSNLNIIGSCVLTGLPTWNARLYDFLNSTTRKVIEGIRIPGFDLRLDGDSFTSKRRFGLRLSSFLKSRSQADRIPIWKIIEQAMENAEVPRTRMMSVSDVREVAKAGVEIGCHSFSHEFMIFESEQFFMNDFAAAQDFFRTQLDLPVNIYAFPYGICLPWHIGFLRAKGVRQILLVGDKPTRHRTGVYDRVNLYGNSLAELRLRALGLLSWRGAKRFRFNSSC